MAIQSVSIDAGKEQDPSSIKYRWGIDANVYTLESAQIDLQDLMVLVSKNRASSVEAEVQPLSARIQQRNKRLEELGSLLADLTKTQTAFDKDAKGSDTGTLDVFRYDDYPTNSIPSSATRLLQEMGYSVGYTEFADGVAVPDFYYYYDMNYTDPDKKFKPSVTKGYYVNKQTVEGAIQKVKSTIDAENNESQLDMSRLQQLVDRRDQSYSTATTLMTAISDTRANLIRNF